MWTAFWDQMAAVLHSFRHNRWRSFLTLLGMIIGSGSVVLLSGLLAGGREALISTNQFINEADVVEVRGSDPPPSQLGRTLRPIDIWDEQGLDRNPAIGGGEVEGELRNWQRWAYFGKDKKRVLLMGAEVRSAPLYRISVVRGRFFNDNDLHERARVCVVGDEVWNTLLGARESLDGVAVRVDGVHYQVIGVLKSKPPLNAGPGAWTWDRRILVPSTTFQMAVRHSRTVDRLYVRLLPSPLDLGQRLSSARGLIKKVLLRRHYGVENFNFRGEDGQKAQEELIFTIINVLMLCTAALSLFVGGINIMNIMLVTVTERTREIGILRALGATRGNILRQFMLESAIIAGLGGLIGVLGGAASVFLASWGLGAWLGSWTAYYKVWAIVLGLLSSTLTGILFGLYPAWRAAAMDPVEALRYE